VSIRRLSDSAEFLLQPQQSYRAPTEDEDFTSSDLGGFDECFPSVSLVHLDGKTTIPDHGDLWRVPWDASPTHDSLLLTAAARSIPVRFQRRLSLQDETLHLEYELRNLGDVPHSFVYAAHPLLQIEEGDRILLPEEVNRVRLEGWTIDSRPSGESLSWPTVELGLNATHDLSSIGSRDGKSATKIFAGPLSIGRAGLYRSKLRSSIMLSFDVRQLPYLGVWICQGAWPNNSTPTGHYTVALEPTTSPYDSLAMARTAGTASVLEPGSRIQWKLSFTIIDFKDIEAFRYVLNGDSEGY
jgi:galactose mutarotase-like enzyme